MSVKVWVTAVLVGVFSSNFGCRERVELTFDTPKASARDRDGVNGDAAAGAGENARGGPETPAQAGSAGETSSPDAAGATPSGAGGEPGLSPEGSLADSPAVLHCAGRRESGDCRISGSAERGVRIIATLLEPAATRVGGSLDLDPSGVIRCVDCDCGDPDGKLVLDCPELVASPGLINLHDHLSYAGTPPLPHPGELYQHRNDWRLGEHGHAALPFHGAASKTEVLAQELRMLLGGATSIVGSGGKPGLLRNLELPELCEGIWPGKLDAETFPLDDSRGSVDSATCGFGQHPDSPALARGFHAYLAHLGEGTNQRAADELDCALGPLGLLGSNAAVVHAMALTQTGAKRLQASGASVIWSPRSNLSLYGSTAPVALLDSLGVKLALGTDWLASGSMSLLRELACAQSYSQTNLNGYFSDFDFWRMVTENPAWAVGLQRQLGALLPGLVGDVALFMAHGGDPYAAVTHAEPQDVALVLRAGQPLYGDADLMSALGRPDCEALEVCSSPKAVCAAETGSSLAEIRAAGEAVYPLFSCDAPPEEPPCEAVTAGLDAETDLEAKALAFASSDADLDGVPDVRDLCPRQPDPEQHDQDHDGRGDACDACPTATPALVPCPTTIAQLRAPATRLELGTPVALRAVRVTALRQTSGFYVEDGDHAAYSGIFVYTGRAVPGLFAGALVDVNGYFQSFAGSDEIATAEAQNIVAGSDYAPLDVALSDLSDGSSRALELASLLVRIHGASVAESNPDAPSDYDETLLEGGLGLDDLLLPELDNDFAPHATFASISGIAGFSFGHRKLFPRAPADLVLAP